MTEYKLSLQQKRLSDLRSRGLLPRAARIVFDIAPEFSESQVKAALLCCTRTFEALSTRYRCVPGLRYDVAETVDSNVADLLEWHQWPADDERASRLTNAQVRKTGVASFQLSPLDVPAPDVPPTSPLKIYWQDASTTSSGRHRFALFVDARSIDCRAAMLLRDQLAARLTAQRTPQEWLDYSDFCAWQQSLFDADADDAQEDLNAACSYWRSQRFQHLDPLQFPTSRFHVPLIEERAPGPLEAVNTKQLSLSRDLVEGVRLLAQRDASADVADYLQAVWAVLVSRRSGAQRLCMPSYCIERPLEELDECFGLLDSYLPINLTMDDSYSWTELAQRCHQLRKKNLEFSEFYRWEASLDLVGAGDAVNQGMRNGVNEGRADVSSLPAVPSLQQAAAFKCVDWRSAFAGKSGETEVGIEAVEHRCDWHALELDISSQREGGLLVSLRGSQKLVCAQDIDQLLSQWQLLLQRWLANPEQPVTEVSAVLAADATALTLSGNDRQWSASSLLSSIATQARLHANDVAVRYEDDCLTYAQLFWQISVVGSHLQQCSTPGARIAVAMTRCVELLPVLLGVMYSGRVFVAVDPAWPANRISQILADSACEQLITQVAGRQMVEQSGVDAIVVEELLPSAAGGCDTTGDFDQSPLEMNPDAEALAYIMYTSGTSGQPKGVMVSHGQLCNYVNALADDLALQEGGHFGWISTFAADLGYTMVFPALLRAGCVHLLDIHRAMDVQALNAYCEAHPLDYLKIVPSHCQALLQAAECANSPAGFLPKDALLLGGEACSYQLLKMLLRSDCHASDGLKKPSRIINHYGPTETTIGVMWSELSAAQPYGLSRLLANNRIYILNQDNKPVLAGCEGLLAIAGANVSSGYWGDAVLTERKFIELDLWQQPCEKRERCYLTGDRAVRSADGRVHILGRADNQLKIRGYRVELEEIEQHLLRLDAVRACVALVHPVKAEQLVAYVSPGDPDELNTLTVKAELAAHLPEYMIPGQIVKLGQLPLTANGKVDRTALPDPGEMRETRYVAPRDDAEAVMVSIWKQVLQLEKVGIEDNFYDIGGHSLLGIRLLSQVQSQFRTEVQPGAVVSAPTPATLTAHLRTLETRPGLIDKIASARIRVANMSEEEKQVVSARAQANQQVAGARVEQLSGKPSVSG